jgi:hypothetical protein
MYNSHPCIRYFLKLIIFQLTRYRIKNSMIRTYRKSVYHATMRRDHLFLIFEMASGLSNLHVSSYIPFAVAEGNISPAHSILV